MTGPSRHEEEPRYLFFARQTTPLAPGVHFASAAPMSVILAHLSSLPLVGSFGYLAAVYSIHSFMSNGRETAMAIPKSVLVLYNASAGDHQCIRRVQDC